MLGRNCGDRRDGQDEGDEDTTWMDEAGIGIDAVLLEAEDGDNAG